MWEFLFEFLADFLILVGLKKRKDKKAELASFETNDSTHKEECSERVDRQGIPICAGCHRELGKNAIHEFRKPWCIECYKTHVLKVKS